MKYSTFGINYNCASVELRQKITLNHQEVTKALKAIKTTLEPSLGPLELAMVCTCNRSEIYAYGRAEPQELFKALALHLQLEKKDADLMVAKSYQFSHLEVAYHLFRVASGLDSMILGENEVLDQLKQSYQLAHAQGLTAKHLNKLFQSAFLSAKQVRTHTSISQNPTSLASCALRLIDSIYSQLSDKTFLIIGVSTMTRLFLEYLEATLKRTQQSQQHFEPIKLIIANRSIQKALHWQQSLSHHTFLDCSVIKLEHAQSALAQADICVSATSAQKPLFSGDDLASLAHNRPTQKGALVVVDLAVPYDFEPCDNLEDLDNLYLFNIDDLERMVNDSKQKRQKASVDAEQLLAQSLKQFELSLDEMDYDTLIATIQSHYQKMQKPLIDKAISKIEKGQLAEEVIKDLSHQLTQKFTHQPLIQIKSLARQNLSTLEKEATMKLIEQIFTPQSLNNTPKGNDD